MTKAIPDNTATSIPKGTQDETEDQPAVLRIGPVAYLRTMWALLWTAFRHPFTTTYIDATTGKVLKP